MTDERHDDEALGRALSRAIETQTPNETPYERSRIADRPARRGLGFWRFAGVAAALVLALAFGSWFTRPSETGPVAASPSATATANKTPTATQSAVATTEAGTSTRVFFVRDLLPPVSANVVGHGTATGPDQRVLLRIGAAHDAADSAVPAGAANPLALVGRITTPTGGSSAYGVGVQISGDTAKVEFDLPNGWGVHGAAQVQGLVQQLVYVITEEPGIRKALITERGKTNAVIDGLVVDKALSREDVSDYDALGSTKPALGYGDASSAASRKLTTTTGVESVAPGMARFVIATDLQNVSPTVTHPDFKVEVFQNDESAKPLGGKWRMVVTVNGTDASIGTLNIDKSPLRSVVTTKQGNNTVYEIGMDDLRPWRTALAFNPVRIIVDIGGDPRTIFGDTNAVYAPTYGAAVGRTFQVSGIAHNFEAHVDIRVLDDKLKEIYRGNTTATICCDPGGTFDTTVQLPANVTGNIYLEVFEASAKDGSDTKVIRIPLMVR